MLSTCIGRKHCRTLGCRCVSRNGDCRGSNQNGVPDQAISEERVASDSDREGRRPDPPKDLKNHMPYLQIGDMAKRALVVIEYEFPRGDNELFHNILPFFI